MAQHLLSARRVTALLGGGKPRRHGDGGCLYLQVNGPNRGAWVFMTKRGGKQRPIGLGSARDLSLKDARELAEACRRAVSLGRDPKTVLADAAGNLTFETAARALIESMAPGWRNAKHHAQWRMTLLAEMVAGGGSTKKTGHDYCAAIRNKPVSKLTTEDALRVIKSLWQSRPETANRLRGRCERVWDFARARGQCSGENPFRWRGHLDKLLPKRPLLTRGHHKAMPFADVPAFMGRLRAKQGVATRALEFAILTAARSGEVLGARWKEIDFQTKVLTVPPGRTKGGREHRVPLSERAMAILAEFEQARVSDFVFPGLKRGRPLSDMALQGVLRRAKVDCTVHGFRSSFRDWAGDSTTFARDVVEAALAHAIENKTEAAYRRGTALDKRRKLMAAWATYCNSEKETDGKVTPLRRVRGTRSRSMPTS
jgi:integrase